MTLGCLQELRWDQAFVRRDSARMRLFRLWIVLRTFVVLARPETVYGEAGKNWRAYLPEAEKKLVDEVRQPEATP